MDKHCARHPLAAALTACASCRHALCGECWRHDVNSLPWCEPCLRHISSSGSGVTLAALFLATNLALAAIGFRWEAARGGEHHWAFWFTYALAASGAALYLGRRRRRQPAAAVRERAADAQPALAPEARVGRPYRAALQRATRFVASPVSGVWTTVLLLGCMVVVALALPGWLQMPRWLEAESVIGLWWLLWTLTLAVLLYRGWRLADDHVLAAPRPPWRRSSAEDVAAGGLDALGYAEDLFLGLAVLALLGLAWLLVELLLPGVFFLAYLLVRNSLAHVANDQHQCQGHWPRALGWGAAWASLYALPLALALFLVRRWISA